MLADEKEYLTCVQGNKDRLPKQLLKILINQFNLVAWELDVKKRLIYPNETTKHLFGSGCLPIEVSAHLTKSGLSNGKPTGIFSDMHERLFAGDANIACEKKVRMQDGTYRWLNVKYVLFFDQEHKPYWAIGCYEDITADKELRERYKQLKIYRQIFTSDAVLAYEVDLDADVILAFDKKSLNTNIDVGSPFSAFIQEVAAKFVHPDFQGQFSQVFDRDNLMADFRSGKKEVVYEFISNENGIEYRWLRETVRLVRHSDTGHICAFLCVKNIDKEKNEEIALRKNASRDPLTSLYNRNTFEKAVNEYIQSDRKNDRVAALIMLDVDDFKKINDTYGHVFGDTVLCMYADKIKEIFRTDDVLSRLGGDEFVVFIKDTQSKEFALKAAQKLCVGMRSWRMEGNYSFESSCSVGVAMYPLHGKDFCTLYEKADEAQYHAKKNGKNHCCMYGTY